MATESQIQANRKNAQKSTGPKTIEGKKAVAKNALKHGLFTNEAVIAGESLEDYNCLRDKTLEELCPVGNMEIILAERIVSLTWRLKRVERFQSIVIDAMIDKKLNSPCSNYAKKLTPPHLRSERDDEDNIDMTLGRVIISDYSDSRVLDRLSMYERRIENSLFKTINEFRKTQILREMDKQKKETEQITETEKESEILEKSSYKRPDMGDSKREMGRRSSPHEIGKSRHTKQPQCDRQKQPSHGVRKNEKQSQSAGLQPEFLNTKSEMLNKFEGFKC